MTARLPLFHRPRYRSIRWGAYAEQCANRAVANGRVYMIACAALARRSEDGMSEQSDTPRSGVLVPSDELKRLQRERDELQAKVAELVENGERLKAVADAAVRDAADMAEAKCSLLRDRIEHQVAQAQNERDEARVEMAEMEGALRASGALNQKLLDEVDRLRALTICGCGDHFAIGFEGTCPNCIAAGKEGKS